MLKKMTLAILCYFIASSIAFAQGKQVSGVVISSEDNQPVIGASVVVTGTSTGTVTDFDGRFSFEAPSSAKTIKVSYVGMKTAEHKIGRNIKVVLHPDTEALDEVVVTGYGVSRKAAFTGAAQVVDDKVLKQTTDSDPIKALTGTVAGLQMDATSGQPGAYNGVTIRGIGSFNSGTQPLYVVDGVPVVSQQMGMRASEGSTINPLATLNPNDIASITVLKDATATSIYGARASNGVIVIKTKSGQSGSVKVNFSAKVGTSMMPELGGTAMLNAADYMDFAGEMAVNTGWLAENTLESTVAFFQANGAPYDPNADANWEDAVTRNGLTQEYNIDINGGNEKLRYYISGGYYNEKGTIIGKDLERYSGRFNLENKLNDYVSFGLNTTASYTDMNGGAGGGYFSDPLTQARMQLPTTPIYTEDGEFNFNTINGYNPVAQRSAKGDINNAKQIKALISPWLNLSYKDFTFLSRYGLDFYNVRETGLWSKMQPQGNDMNMMGEEGNDYYTLWTWTNTLNYMKRIGKNNINVLVGQEAQKATLRSSYLAGSNYPSDVVTSVENAATPSSAATSFSNYALMSVFGNVEYDYADKYYLSGSLRADGSSRFGVDNRWATFWSVGGKYRFSAEEYMSGISDWFTNGVLRASYGTTGNQDISWYQAQGLYGFGFNYQNRPGMVPTQIANPDLRWESTSKFNVGLELAFLSRLTLDVDYYVNRTTDMLFNVPLSYTTGFSSIMKNIGEMSNKGVELMIVANIIQRSNVRWDLRVNMTHNQNRIEKLSTDLPIEGTYTIYEAGRPFNTFKMQEYAGVDPKTGAPMWYVGEEGTETTADYNKAGKRYLGSADPKIYGGFSTNLQVYDFDLAAQFNYSVGGKIYASASRYDENTSNIFGNTTQYVYDNMWREEGDVTDVPAPVYGQNKSASSRYLMDGSYLKLKSVQLGYTLPVKFAQKAMLNNVRVYVSGENLFTVHPGSKDRVSNPETSSDGVIWWNYPPARRVLFGLNVSF